jgi:predicted DNA-binding protein (MmcQ/YjbR family)
VVYKIGGKMFAIVADEEPPRFTLKCDPVLAEIMRGQYAAITPGYHTDKRHWITIRQDAELPDAAVTRLFDHAYDIVRAKLTRAAKAELAAAEGAPP